MPPILSIPGRDDSIADSEAGLSLIEALVVVALSSVIALAVLPLANRSAERQVSTAERAIGLVEESRAARDFRASLENARAETFGGTSDELRAMLLAPAPAACGSGGGVELRIVRSRDGGALVCGEGPALLRWRTGAARFSYSADGEAWADAWVPPPLVEGGERRPARAPLVRFEWRAGPARGVSWVARAGGMRPLSLEPTRAPADAAQ